MQPTQPTRVAVLGTLAEFHREPIPYDLGALVDLVAGIRPDLLCLDMTPDAWRSRDFGGLPPEYREALLPLARRTDIVVVPVAGSASAPEPSAPGWRGRAIERARRLLARLQGSAPDAAAVNEGPRHHAADVLYDLMARLAGGDVRHAWRAHARELAERVAAAAERDPGSRVLVVVNARHCHHVRRDLARRPDIRLVRFAEL